MTASQKYFSNEFKSVFSFSILFLDIFFSFWKEKNSGLKHDFGIQPQIHLWIWIQKNAQY